ncbi:MAG: HNH endonuclease [Promethearchaeota archaeon]
MNCHRTTVLEYDHILPFSKGGATSIDNIQLLYQRCNRRKYNHIQEPIPEVISKSEQESNKKPRNNQIPISIFKRIMRKLQGNTSISPRNITL